MLNKLIKQRYKIFTFADNNYIYHFQLSFRHYRIAELVKYRELTLTSSIVLQIIQLLPKFDNSHFVLYLDNYFTSISLFSKLRTENINAIETTRP